MQSSARIYFLCVIYLNSMQQQQNILFVYSHAKHNYPFSHKSIAYYHEDFFIFLKNREKQKKKIQVRNDERKNLPIYAMRA